jgi:hypothetical protein
MLYLQTSHGVLTDAIVYVFVRTRWTVRRLHVEHYVRHRADTMPTDSQCFAHICRLVADASPLDVPQDVLSRLLMHIKGGSRQGAQTNGAAGSVCVAPDLLVRDQGCTVSSACLSSAAMMYSTGSTLHRAVLRCMPCQLKHLMRAGRLLPPAAAHPPQGLWGVRKTAAVAIFRSMSWNAT